jgi:hypothetical protein
MKTYNRSFALICVTSKNRAIMYRKMITSLFKHLESIGDIQTLAMLIAIFLKADDLIEECRNVPETTLELRRTLAQFETTPTKHRNLAASNTVLNTSIMHRSPENLFENPFRTKLVKSVSPPSLPTYATYEKHTVDTVRRIPRMETSPMKSTMHRTHSDLFPLAKSILPSSSIHSALSSTAAEPSPKTSKLHLYRVIHDVAFERGGFSIGNTIFENKRAPLLDKEMERQYIQFGALYANHLHAWGIIVLHKDYTRNELSCLK